MRDAPVVLEGVPLRVDPAEVRAFHGYKAPLGGHSAELGPRLDAILTEVSSVVRPRVVYRTVGVTRADPNRLTLEDGTRLHIPDIGLHWGAVEAVTAALATIGNGAEALARGRRETGDGLGAALLDSAASAAVECLAEWMNDYLCQSGVSDGRRVTNRISPGLAGWDLAEQATLLGLLRAAAIGVRLGADGSMSPEKSISFLVGIGRVARVDHYFVQCRRCWAEGCPARRMPAVGSVNLIAKGAVGGGR